MFNIDPYYDFLLPAVIEFGLLEYRLSVSMQVYIGADFQHWYDQALTKIFAELPLDAVDSVEFLTLLRNDGETLVCKDDEGDAEDWLKSLVIAARLDFAQVRRMHL